MLQRCRSACAAEGLPPRPLHLPLLRASTVPQRVRCGRVGFDAEVVVADAASTVPQRVRCGRRPQPPQHHRPSPGFNGAAARALRKADAGDANNGGTTVLQRCRSACAAEGASMIPLWPAAHRLQRCRSACAAEGEREGEEKGGEHRFNGAAARALRKALVRTGRPARQASLQRCRSACAAEGPFPSCFAGGGPGFNGAAARALRKAALRPCPDKWLPGFNGAAARALRKASRGRGSRRMPSSFNGAAARALRKAWPATPSSPLRTSFNGAAARALRKAPSAKRGRSTSKRFNGAAARALRKGVDSIDASKSNRVLQRCRSACAAEGRRFDRRIEEQPRASTVPQRVRCGRVGLCPSRVSQILAASTVPQRVRCGRGWSRAGRRCRGFASTVPQRVRCGRVPELP